MQYACAKIAELALDLKHQYRHLLGSCAIYGTDKQFTLDMDALGQVVKEIEDAVVVLQIRLEEAQGTQAG